MSTVCTQIPVLCGTVYIAICFFFFMQPPDTRPTGKETNNKNARLEKLRVHGKTRFLRGKSEVSENHGFRGAVNVPQVEKFLHVIFCVQVGLQTLCATIAAIKERIYVDFCNQCYG